MRPAGNERKKCGMKKYDISEFGARDGGPVCTAAIQRAIDLCEKGGTIYVPSGTFVTGALFLKSDMTLYLEKGARLLGSDDLADFPLMGYPFEGYDQICYASLLNTDGAPHHDIAIEGSGVIDANGVALFRKEMEEKRGKRGRAVCIRNTKRLTVRGVTVRQSPSWGLHLIYCSDVCIDGIEVHTKYDENGNRYDPIFNGDGVDLDSCQRVRVTDSLIASQDDCIAVKSGRDAAGRRAGIPSKDIVIENCTLKYGFGVAMGSEMSGGVENVTVRNCAFENTHSIASIKAVRGRGAYIRNILYENCTLVNRGMGLADTKWFRGAIYADAFYGIGEFDPDRKEPVDETTPVAENITLKNITLDTDAGNAIYLCGLPEMPYRNFRLENVKAHGKYGMKTKNMENLDLINVEVTAEEP